MKYENANDSFALILCFKLLEVIWWNECNSSVTVEEIDLLHTLVRLILLYTKRLWESSYIQTRKQFTTKVCTSKSKSGLSFFLFVEEYSRLSVEEYSLQKCFLMEGWKKSDREKCDKVK